MSSLTSITNAVGDAALPFWLLIQNEPLAERVCKNKVQLLNSTWVNEGLLTPPRESIHSSAPFKTIVNRKIMFQMNRSQLLQLVRYWHNRINNKPNCLALKCRRHQTVPGKVQCITEVEQTTFLALGYRLVRTVCERLYCRWLCYTEKTPVKWGRI